MFLMSELGERGYFVMCGHWDVWTLGCADADKGALCLMGVQLICKRGCSR